MLIIGGHDYYDTAASYGVDKTIVLKRDLQDWKIHVKESPLEIPLFHIKEKGSKIFKDRHKALSGVIMFCGETYPFINPNFSSGSDGFIFSHEKFRQELDKKDKQVVKFVRSASVEEFFNTSYDCSDYLIDRKLAFAVLIRSGGHWDINVHPNPSNLKEYGFYRIKDAFTAHMDISSWVGGVLPTNKETVEISDKSRILKAGFDLKKSFRKEKQK